MSKARAFWTEEEIKILKDLHKHGATVEEIAQVLVDRSEDAIRSQLSRYGLKANSQRYTVDYKRYEELLTVLKV